MGKPFIAQLYAQRARQQWAEGNRQLAEVIWQQAKNEWSKWNSNRV